MFINVFTKSCETDFLYNFVVEPPKSNLSAEAKEWYPPNYTPQAVPAYNPEPAQYRPQRFSVQDRLRQAQDQNPYSLNEMSYSLEEAENMDLRVSNSIMYLLQS